MNPISTILRFERPCVTSSNLCHYLQAVDQGFKRNRALAQTEVIGSTLMEEQVLSDEIQLAIS